MIDPDSLTIGDLPVELDNGGHRVDLVRDAEHEWTVARFPHASPVRSARITRTTDADEPWTVTPVSPMYDEETYPTWAEAIRAAGRIEAPRIDRYGE